MSAAIILTAVKVLKPADRKSAYICIQYNTIDAAKNKSDIGNVAEVLRLANNIRLQTVILKILYENELIKRL
jgi:hypothetical protein